MNNHQHLSPILETRPGGKARIISPAKKAQNTKQISPTTMPTPTQYFGYVVTNVGPLTTHFTPAPSCATAKPNVYIVTQLADTRGLFGFPSCEAPKYDGCLPQGESLDRLNRDLATHPRNGNLAYHSPGLQCPSGWKKAGRVVGADTQATKPRGGLSFKGINMSTVMQNGHPGPLPKLHAYASILDPGETLVWCCPKYDASYPVTSPNQKKKGKKPPRFL